MEATTRTARASLAPPGVEAGAVTHWMVDRVPGLVPPLHFELIAGGRSNLTYKVTDSEGAAYALRRPPLSHVLPTAHDVAREHRILSALGPTSVPVPATVGLCADPGVTGAPFYVMTFIEGLVLRDPAVAAATLDAAARPVLGPNLVDVLAALHGVDPDLVGLGDLARRDGYIERQLKRWSAQYATSAAAGVTNPGAVERLGAALAARVPPQVSASIVHGDYRLDNLVVRPQGTVAAVLDWELCTLGDPLADLGTFLNYWELAADGEPVLDVVPASALPGFSPAESLAERYAEATGRDVSDVAYYRAFAYWRLACILQGVYARYIGGAPAGDPGTVEHLPRTVGRLADLAAATLEAL